MSYIHFQHLQAAYSTKHSGMALQSTDTYDGLIESLRRAVEEIVIGHASLAVEARP